MRNLRGNNTMSINRFVEFFLLLHLTVFMDYQPVQIKDFFPPSHSYLSNWSVIAYYFLNSFIFHVHPTFLFVLESILIPVRFYRYAFFSQSPCLIGYFVQHDSTRVSDVSNCCRALIESNFASASYVSVVLITNLYI